MAKKQIKIKNLPDNQHAFIEWEVKNGNFSASGRIYHRSTCCSAGQNLDEILKLAPNDTRVQRIVKVWQEYHLNDLTAGSPSQESHLKTLVKPASFYPVSHYEWACNELEKAGLQPDNSHIRNEKPYAYGSAWLKTELPDIIVNEINSWDEFLE